MGAERVNVGVAQSPADEAFAMAYKKLLSNNAVQFDLPPHKTPPLPGVPPWLKELLEALAMAGPGVRSLLWAGLAVAAALVLFAIFRVVRGRWRRTRPETDDVVEWRPEARSARALLADADELAEAGQFGAAAHLVLLRSVEQIAKHRPNTLRPSLTSRDIVGVAHLPGDVRAAFAAIARIVESGLFASRPVGRDSWLRARAAYEAIAFPKVWR